MYCFARKKIPYGSIYPFGPKTITVLAIRREKQHQEECVCDKKLFSFVGIEGNLINSVKIVLIEFLGT